MKISIGSSHYWKRQNMSNTIIHLVTAMQSESEESNDSRRFSVFSLKSLFLSINVICSFILASFLVPWFSGEFEFIVKLLDKIKAFSKMNSSFWSPPILCSLSIILMHYVTKIDSKINHGYEIEMQFYIMNEYYFFPRKW